MPKDDNWKMLFVVIWTFLRLLSGHLPSTFSAMVFFSEDVPIIYPEPPNLTTFPTMCHLSIWFQKHEKHPPISVHHRVAMYLCNNILRTTISKTSSNSLYNVTISQSICFLAPNHVR